MAEDGKQQKAGAAALPALFLATFAVSMTANSGYAIIGTMREDFVDRRHWLTEDEMADLTAIAQSSPGPIAVNASMAVGNHVAGLAGSAAAVLGCILPPFLVMALVTLFYEAIVGNPVVALFMRGMQLGVVGMLLNVCLGLFRNVTSDGIAYSLVVVVLAFLYIRLTGCSVLYLALACAAAGAIKVALGARGGER